METKSCLHKLCCKCKHFKAIRNEFENTIMCACILHRKGVVGTDVTLITPDLMLSSMDWRLKMTEKEQLKEAKRLLKLAMEDMKILYEAGKDEGCYGIEFKWRFADEAEKLLKED